MPFVRWINHSMCDCSFKRVQFEKKGGKALQTLSIPLAKKRRRGIRGGRRTLVSRERKKLIKNSSNKSYWKLWEKRRMLNYRLFIENRKL